MAKEFSSKFRVYIEDTDAGGVVYYVNYLKFMERARTDYLRALGFPRPALLTDELCLVVTSANIDYKLSARLDDMLTVSATIVKAARSYMIFEQRVTRSCTDYGQEELLALGTVKIACVTQNTMKPAAFPPVLRETALKEQKEPRLNESRSIVNMAPR